MNGANGTTSVAGVLHLPLGRNNSPPPSGRARADRETVHAGADGPLAAGRRILAESLSNSGFVNLAASLEENFTMCLMYQPATTEMGDLKPGALRDLVAWVKSKLAAQAQRSTQAQAHVSPEAAVKLLT
jgi:hypothetical protein